LIHKAVQNAIKNTVEAERQKFETGDYSVILKCMWLCTFFRTQPPDWLIDAFCERVGQPHNFETWDDAFGPPMPPGTKRARREEVKNWVPLALKIRELRARGVKGQALYEQAADELKLRGDWQTVRDAYYRMPKISREWVELAASELEEEILERNGQIAFSDEEDEEFTAWLINHWKTHPPSSS